MNNFTAFSFKDDESNAISVTAFDESNNGTPEYITIYPTAIQIGPSNFRSVGSHTVTIVLSDGQPLNSTYKITIAFTSTAPYFQSLPSILSIPVNSFNTY
jgi:hypothetical protein